MIGNKRTGQKSVFLLPILFLFLGTNDTIVSPNIVRRTAI